VSARLDAVSYALPERILDNAAVVAALGRGSPENVYKNTGILERRVADEGQCGSDFAAAAAERLFESGAARPDEIEFVLYLTQTPDHYVPTTACLLHDRLGLPRNIIALDLNQSCAGYVQLLGVAHGWIAAGLGGCGLLLTGDTMSRLVAPGDPATLPIFGDAGTATVMRACPPEEGLSGFVFGTDGSGGSYLIAEQGGFRHPVEEGGPRPVVRMSGLQIFDFTLTAVPEIVDRCLQAAACDPESVDLYLLHQASGILLRHLVRKLGIAPDKAPIRLERYGNTVSSSIPILLADLAAEGALQAGQRLMLVGFGAGLSWGACLLQLGCQLPQGLPPEL